MDETDPVDRIIEYGSRPGSMRSAGVPPVPPPEITMSIEQRIAARADGTLTADVWRHADDVWFGDADSRYRACVTRHGLPAQAPPLRIGVKDTIDVAGFPTTLGLARHRHHPRHTVGALRGLDPELAAVVAKVVTTELNIGVGSGCVNPYSPGTDPGGSSTGAAVAVAAGLCDLALGTDVLGSVRWPAGQCGTVGLRATHRPSELEGVFPLAPPMDALGWVARTAAELAVAARVLAPRLGSPRPQTDEVTIGVVGEARLAASEPMAGTVDTACALATAAGHRTVEVLLDELWGLRGVAWELCARQAWDSYLVWRDWIQPDLHPTTTAALAVGSAVSDDRYRFALDGLARHRAGIEERFAASGTDVWVLPLDPNPPPTVEQARNNPSTIPNPTDPGYAERIGFTPIASIAGLPAITLPVSRHDDGAPLCVQLLGRPGADLTLIELASQLERQRPDLAFAPG